jgi:hypothetical protein
MEMEDLHTLCSKHRRELGFAGREEHVLPVALRGIDDA